AVRHRPLPPSHRVGLRDHVGERPARRIAALLLGARMSRRRFWIDRGASFTDVVARRPDGRLEALQLLWQKPGGYGDGAAEGLRGLLGRASGEANPAREIEVVKMGTTVATNALLERRGERTALVVTRGFRDALRIAYQNRPRLFD